MLKILNRNTKKVLSKRYLRVIKEKVDYDENDYAWLKKEVPTQCLKTSTKEKLKDQKLNSKKKDEGRYITKTFESSWHEVQPEPKPRHENLVFETKYKRPTRQKIQISKENLTIEKKIISKAVDRNLNTSSVKNNHETSHGFFSERIEIGQKARPILAKVNRDHSTHKVITIKADQKQVPVAEFLVVLDFDDLTEFKADLFERLAANWTEFGFYQNELKQFINFTNFNERTQIPINILRAFSHVYGIEICVERSKKVMKIEKNEIRTTFDAQHFLVESSESSTVIHPLILVADKRLDLFSNDSNDILKPVTLSNGKEVLLLKEKQFPINFKFAEKRQYDENSLQHSYEKIITYPSPQPKLTFLTVIKGSKMKTKFVGEVLLFVSHGKLTKNTTFASLTDNTVFEIMKIFKYTYNKYELPIYRCKISSDYAPRFHDYVMLEKWQLKNLKKPTVPTLAQNLFTENLKKVKKFEDRIQYKTSLFINPVIQANEQDLYAIFSSGKEGAASKKQWLRRMPSKNYKIATQDDYDLLN